MTFEDCTQTGQSAPSCVDEDALAAVTRSGRWILEDKGGANLLVPASSFVLTTDKGRALTGLHFPNDGSLLTTPGCDAEGGECYFARTRTDTVDPGSSCLQVDEHSYAFHVLDGALFGVSVEIRFLGFEETCDDEGACELAPDSACGTSSVQRIQKEIAGEQAEEVVLAREVML